MCCGRIVAQGEPGQVVTEEMVQEVFGIECRIVPDPVTDMPMIVPLGRSAKLTRQIELVNECHMRVLASA
jgi:iron complex transport system ATP-binding protein